MAYLCSRGSVGFVGASELAHITAEFDRGLAGVTQAVPPLLDAARAQGYTIVPVRVRH